MKITVSQCFKVLTMSVLLCLMVPQLFQEGMFMDGLIYSAIAHNLANGFGTYWELSFSQTIMKDFHEHPPLAFILQSLTYDLLGNGFYVDKIYAFLACIVSAGFVRGIWKIIVPNKSLKALWWLPVLLWVITPVISWSYRNINGWLLLKRIYNLANVSAPVVLDLFRRINSHSKGFRIFRIVALAPIPIVICLALY